MKGIVITVVAIVSTILCGCSPKTVYVPVESVRTEYKDRNMSQFVTDTVHDIRFVWVKGDTVHDIREREHVRLVSVHDTCLFERIDTIRVPYPVERQLTRWEKTKMDYGGEKWNVSLRWVQRLCKENWIKGAMNTTVFGLYR